jgi:hypothetical protein
MKIFVLRPYHPGGMALAPAGNGREEKKPKI